MLLGQTNSGLTTEDSEFLKCSGLFFGVKNCSLVFGLPSTCSRLRLKVLRLRLIGVKSRSRRHILSSVLTKRKTFVIVLVCKQPQSLLLGENNLAVRSRTGFSNGT